MQTDGRIQPRVAAAAPAKPAVCQPVKEAALSVTGPGVISAMAQRLVKSASVSQPVACTASSRISAREA